MRAITIVKSLHSLIRYFLFSAFKAAGYTSGAMASGTGYVMARVGCDWRIFQNEVQNTDVYFRVELFKMTKHFIFESKNVKNRRICVL